MRDIIKKQRLKILRNYLKFLEENPNDWNDLRLSCRNNVSEYSSTLTHILVSKGTKLSRIAILKVKRELTQFNKRL